MKLFILAMIVGIGTGGLYAMMSTGLVIAYKGSGIINFGHTAIGMFAAFTFDEVKKTGHLKLPLFDFIPDWMPKHLRNIPITIKVAGEKGGSTVLAVAMALLMTAVLGLLCHFLVFRPLRNASALSKVIGSVGVLLYVQAVSVLGYGTSNRTPAGFLPGGRIRNFLGLGGDLATAYVTLAVCALVLGLLVWALYQKTPFGLMTRAADENEKGAVVLGFSPQLIAGTNWVLSAVTAGIGAVLYVGITSLNIGSYTGFIVPALSAALIGNLTNIWGTVFGGLGLGMVSSGLTYLAGRAWWPKWAPANGVRSVLPLLVVIGVLYFRGNKIPLRGAIAPPRQARVPMQKLPWIAPLVAAVGYGIISIIFTSSWEVALTTSIVSAVIMLSMVVVIGFLGQISLAQMSLAGVSAYALIRFTSKGKVIQDVRVAGPGLPHPLAALLAIAVTVVIGLIIAAPALRIRGVQLAVVTMTAVIAIQEFIFRNEKIVGAGAKANNPVPRPSWFGWDVSVTYKMNKENPSASNTFTDRWHFTVFALIFLVALVWMLNNLRRSGTGRRFLAIRSNERAASSGGINVAQTKLLGFGIGAAVAAIGGILFAYKIQFVKFENFDLFIGLGLLAFAVIGGITTPAGSIVGGFLGAGGIVAFFFAERFHSPNFTKYVGIIGAIALIFNAIQNPEGIAGGIAFKKPKAHKAKKEVAA